MIFSGFLLYNYKNKITSYLDKARKTYFFALAFINSVQPNLLEFKVDSKQSLAAKLPSADTNTIKLLQFGICWSVYKLYMYVIHAATLNILDANLYNPPPPYVEVWNI